MLKKLHQAPKDIRYLVLQTPKIPRYKGFTGLYAEGIFDDNLGLHIVRCVNRVDTLSLLPKQKNLIKRILWVHDLPEIETGDLTRIEKETDHKLAQQMAQEEEEVISSLIPPKWRSLIKEFELASSLLKGKSEKGNVWPEAVVAKVIDSIDGNEIFHQSLADWMQSNEYDSGKVPTESALGYTFKMTRTYQSSLDELVLPLDFTKTAKDLLKQQLQVVLESWDAVPSKRIPQVLRRELDLVSQ